MANDNFGRLIKNIFVVRGDTKTQRMIVKDSDGAVVDVTGYSAKLSVNTEPNPADETNELFELTGVLTDAVNGVIDFTPTALQAKQTPDVYFYDIQITTDVSVVCTVASGKWTVGADVTDANV